MNSLAQRCRPKHQVLILKCYPKYTKSNPDVKPNSSELSYLLYYASTRRSKLQKVGDFLEKRTTSDVWKGRIGNVQVTLQILKALIEKCPRDLPLYATPVLAILKTVLASNDITMIQESVPTFESFCAHQNPATLAADQDYIQQYTQVVKTYASFASKETPVQPKTPVSVPVALKYRKAGLQAVKSVASSESLGAETGRQLALVVPVILENLYSKDGSFLTLLQERDEKQEEMEKELAIRRRQSISTVRTHESEADPIAASGTAEDVDRLAEEEVGIMALQALREIFSTSNRGQLRLATSTVLKFIGPRSQTHVKYAHSWPATLFIMICEWAPVQDRFVILVTVMETLIRSPLVEEDLTRQLDLTTIVNTLLGADINFIGLSVMDVLVGLIQHVLLLLQLGGNGSSIRPHSQKVDAIAPVSGHDFGAEPSADSNATIVATASPARVQLLDRLQRCIAALATHVYYTDQHADMITALLMRLKPSPLSGISSTAAAIENPAAAVESVASTASLQEKPHTDGFFSFEMARITALQSVKDILTVTKSRNANSDSTAVNEGHIGVDVWEGTQWLLRDPSWLVRKAYVDALLTWLGQDIKKSRLRVVDDRKRNRSAERKDEKRSSSLAKRAVSNASRRERDKSPKRPGSHFLQLLHLAVYENAQQYSESEPDILLLHLLLTSLVQKLGVNAVRSGLPMIFRLQEDIALVESPTAKTHIGSVVHGYFWALSDNFDFETSTVGQEIQNEISRRNQHGIWLAGIRLPPIPLSQLQQPTFSEQLPTSLVQSEALIPFDNRTALVDAIEDGYASSLHSPPTSPPTSPSRGYSGPILTTSSIPTKLPAKAKEDLLSTWTKESCMAVVTSKEKSSRSASLGSRGGVSAVGTQRLLSISAPAGAAKDASADPSHRLSNYSRPPSTKNGATSHLATGRRASNTPTHFSTTSSVRSAPRIDDLKRVLSGSQLPSFGGRYDNDTGSESMISAEDFGVASDIGSLNGPMDEEDNDITPRPTHMNAPEPKVNAVPPVPPVPVSFRDSVSPPPSVLQGKRPRTSAGTTTGGAKGTGVAFGVGKAFSTKSRRRSASIKEGQRKGWESASTATGRMDFSDLLDAIDVGSESPGVEKVVRPPY